MTNKIRQKMIDIWTENGYINYWIYRVRYSQAGYASSILVTRISFQLKNNDFLPSFPLSKIPVSSQCLDSMGLEYTGSWLVEPFSLF
jgi:hypothetical protein